MVAARRPHDLPIPSTDGMPARAIGPHSLDKLDYWGRFLWGSSWATSKKFSGVRTYADLFASNGVCRNRNDGELCWGSALLSLQVPIPFDLYFLNDIDPEATRALAERVERLGIQGAHVFELDLDASDALARVRQIRDVVVPWGPKSLSRPETRTERTAP
jgi:three-Cys-motif partner protein